nr:hypothetical protein [Tanacetum cinerariifolium]
MVDSFVLVMLPELDLDAGFFVNTHLYDFPSVLVLSFISSILASYELINSTLCNISDDLEPDEKSVDTPLASLFLDSNDDSDDGEVLNELEEHSNAGQLCRQRDEVPPKSNNDMPLRDKMDDPNITMEDYIRLEEEKAHRSGKVFNWETAKYAIVYNDALTSKLGFLTEPTVNPQHIDEFNLKDETSLSEYKDNDDDKVNIEHSSRDLSIEPLPNVINMDVGAYAHGSNMLLEATAGFTRMRVYYSEELKYAVGLGYKVVLWCGEISAIKEKRELVGLILQIKALTYMHVDDDLWLGVKVIRACMYISSLRPLIMEYMVNISKRKMLHIRACTHQRPQRKPVQYAVFSEDQYTVLKI